MTNTANLPQELKDGALFCVWKLEEVNGRPTKVPYNPQTGGKAQSNNPDTFSTFPVAAAVQEQYSGMGVGIFGNLCAIDIDHCIDGDAIFDMALDINFIMESYTEKSPSGTGLRILFYASDFVYDKEKYYINNTKMGLEIYVAGATNKYVTVTGNTLLPIAIEERGEALQRVLDKYMLRPEKDVEVREATVPPPNAMDNSLLIAKAAGSKNGAAFTALWGGDCTGYESQSEADLALCNMLAFWTGRDPQRMDELFRQSGLMRDKWDRAQSGSTYGAITIQKAIDGCREVYDPRGYTGATAIEDFSTLDPSNYQHTDIGAGDIFADQYQDVVRYVAQQRTYFVWDGKRWAEDAEERVKELTKILVSKIMPGMARSIEDDDARASWLRWATKLQANPKRNEMLISARSKPEIAARLSSFDKESRYLNLQNGVYDLEEGKLLPHDKDLMISMMANAAYDPNATCARWDSFILEVMAGDKEAARFLQKAVGYSLCGDPVEDCLLVLYGEKTRNGKSTFCKSILNVMGDYGKSAQPESLAVNRNRTGSGPNSDIARLRGARFVSMPEAGKGMELDGALVKQLTGRDIIVARHMHREFFEYTPQFVLFMNTNYLPRIDDMTLFTSGRILCLPFPVHFPVEKQEKSLGQQFSTPQAMSAILNWCLEGHAMYLEEGLKENLPAVVQRATEEYQDNSDTFGGFLRDCVLDCENDWTQSTRVYQEYAHWIDENGHRPLSMKSFVAEMRRRGYESHKRKTGMGFKDITLRSEYPYDRSA
ncbi:phage/plasmid primase, P4 family [Eubacteriales bacterium OttesenSCG-928-M02]|nr:phage/plasmid primase, P4 family [Eubacteriales bacterium OttesenSCG-928-M02]